MVKCPLQTSAAGEDARLEGDSSWDRLNEDACHTLRIRRKHVNIGPFYAGLGIVDGSAVQCFICHFNSCHTVYDFSRIVIVI